MMTFLLYKRRLETISTSKPCRRKKPTKNRLSTGTFSFSDLENTADYSSKSIGAEYHHYGSYDKMGRQEKNKVTTP